MQTVHPTALGGADTMMYFKWIPGTNKADPQPLLSLVSDCKLPPATLHTNFDATAIHIRLQAQQSRVHIHKHIQMHMQVHNTYHTPVHSGPQHRMQQRSTLKTTTQHLTR